MIFFGDAEGGIISIRRTESESNIKHIGFVDGSGIFVGVFILRARQYSINQSKQSDLRTFDMRFALK